MEILEKCLRAFNEIPNTQLECVPDISNTYELAAEISKLLGIPLDE